MAQVEFGGVPNIQAVYSPEASITLFPGDVQDLLATLPDGCVKLVVSSPPYNIGKKYETRTPLDTYLAEQARIIRELYRVLQSEGSICWQVGNYVNAGEVIPLDVLFYPIFKSLGMKLRNRIVWHFGHGLHATKRLSGRYETLLWFTKTDIYTFNLDPIRVPSKYPGKRYYKGPHQGKLSGNPAGKNPSDVWEIMAEEWETGLWDIPNVKSNHPEKTIHPAQFPIELVERCVLAFTDPHDLVFDPYSGVGSSIIAALKNNRRGLGSERDPEYVAIAKDRLTKFHRGQLPIRELGKPVHVPTGNESVAQIPEEWQARRLFDRGDDA